MSGSWDEIFNVRTMQILQCLFLNNILQPKQQLERIQF